MNTDYVGSMTVLSLAAYESATEAGLSPQEAAAALLNTVEVRRFKDILGMFSTESDLRKTLTDGLCANDATRNSASVDKKVRGWLSGKYQPTAREDLLELCFVLHLSVENANAFLTMTGDEGLHWRNVRELVYAYALDRGMNYQEAKQLLERVSPEGSRSDESESSFTPLIRREVQQCATEDELRQYLKEAAGKLGRLHNSAYRQFTAMMQVLEKPESCNASSERRYTVREIMETYLDKRLPSQREGKKLGEKKSAILADWPDEITLSKMKKRRIDVTRKVLILLFLVTDGIEESAQDWQDDDWYADEPQDPQTAADMEFRSSRIRINQMLADCGFGMLDPRNPFDWIALYCMRIDGQSAGWDGLNERLSQVLDVLFAAAEPQA